MLSYSELDEIDRSIINILQDNPLITHSRIAKQLDRSQPAIGARIKKLKDNGTLETQVGVNYRLMQELEIAHVQLRTSNPKQVLEIARTCPYIINAFKVSGDFNIQLFVVGKNVHIVDKVIDQHLRQQPFIDSLVYGVVTDMADDFIMPINLRVFDDEETSITNCDICGKCVSTPNIADTSLEPHKSVSNKTLIKY